MSYSVTIEHSTVPAPYYASVVAMDRWCYQHAGDRWKNGPVMRFQDDGTQVPTNQVDYLTFVFEDKDIAALFKLTWWRP